MTHLSTKILANVLDTPVTDFYIRSDDTITVWTNEKDSFFVNKYKFVHLAKVWAYNCIKKGSLFVLSGMDETYFTDLSFGVTIGGFRKTFYSDESEEDAVMMACDWLIDYKATLS